MKKLLILFCLLATSFAQQSAAPAPPKAPAQTPAAAPAAPPTMAQILDRELSGIEREVVPLAEAMPEDKYGFVPTGEGFKTVRTFRQQIGHIAAVLHIFSAPLIGEEAATGLTSVDELHGPATLKTKDDYVKFLKDGFARAHRAMATINEKNFNEMVPNKIMNFTLARLRVAVLLTSHSFDHYGQLAIYLRMNNIVPPASRAN